MESQVSRALAPHRGCASALSGLSGLPLNRLLEKFEPQGGKLGRGLMIAAVAMTPTFRLAEPRLMPQLLQLCGKLSRMSGMHTII